MPVYLIRAGAFGDVKIGVATDPTARMRQLQTSLSSKLRLVRLLEGGQPEEYALHQRFAAQRKVGEWFAGSRELLTGDLGLPDLPIPASKRGYRYPDNARGRLVQMQDDLFECVGGKESLARALAIAPWKLASPLPVHFSALVLLARQNGADLTYRDYILVQEAAEVEIAREAEARGSIRSLIEVDRNQELDWVKRNGPSSIWWQRFTTDAEHEFAPTPQAAA